MICSNCGYSNNEENLYCGKCGKKLINKQGYGSTIAAIVVLCVVIYAMILVGVGGRNQQTNQSVQNPMENHSEFKQLNGKQLNYVDGDWENITLNDANNTWNIYSFVLSQELRRCKQLTIQMEVNMNANTHCKEWQLWGRVGGQYTKLDKILLPKGNGTTTQTVFFDPPISFDAIAITPTVQGSYSWTMGLAVTNVEME